MKRLTGINDFRIDPINPIFPVNNQKRKEPQDTNQNKKNVNQDSFEQIFNQEMNKK